MTLYTLGINHTTAPVTVRERMVFAPEQVARALRELIRVSGVAEAAILSTCNRTELYCDLEDPSQDRQVLAWLSDFHRFSHHEIEPYLYHHLHRNAVRHALRVACGLDSMVLGEPQILGQFKHAYQDASAAGTLGRHLNRLFQHAFAVAKRVRTDTAIGSSPVSVAFAAVNLAKQIFGELNEQSALLIGAGETIELAARHLKGSSIGHVVVANRSVERARRLAEQFAGEAIGLPDIVQALPRADIVITSTASPLPILGKGLVERALRRRRHRPIFMVDIAVPRDVEPEVGELDDVYLYTIDDLEEVIQEGLQSRREAAHQADEIIHAQVENFMAWLRSQDAVSTICAYRARANEERQAALAKATSMLRQGKSAEEVLQYLAHRLTNKLTHAPTHALHQAGREGDQALLEAARLLLNLPDDLP